MQANFNWLIKAIKSLNRDDLNYGKYCFIPVQLSSA